MKKIKMSMFFVFLVILVSVVNMFFFQFQNVYMISCALLLCNNIFLCWGIKEHKGYKTWKEFFKLELQLVCLTLAVLLFTLKYVLPDFSNGLHIMAVGFLIMSIGVNIKKVIRN